jgi:serine phosphatase RsbU (regulator of sigma subunit)
MVLGLFESAAFDEETVTLAPGDVIVSFSDGVTEALSAAEEEFGDERLLASIRAHIAKPLEAMLHAVLGDVHTFCSGAPPNDDVTLVLMRYDGPSSVNG